MFFGNGVVVKYGIYGQTRLQAIQGARHSCPRRQPTAVWVDTGLFGGRRGSGTVHRAVLVTATPNFDRPAIVVFERCLVDQLPSTNRQTQHANVERRVTINGIAVLGTGDFTNVLEFL
tara:strand:- start:347 stop:700 length:354 start_codon:yes stop_codon:yes gene_type:complete